MHLATGYTTPVTLVSLSILRSMMLSVSKNIPIGGPHLIEKAKMIANSLEEVRLRDRRDGLSNGRRDLLSSS